MNNNIVSIKGKAFVAIGKMIFNHNSHWKIPHVHFMVDKVLDSVYEATCLEFGLVASGNDPEEATKRLGVLIHFHITTVMNEGNGYKEFIAMAEDHCMDDFWAAFRAIDFSLCEQGISLSNTLDERISMAIQDMFDKQVQESIIKKAGEHADAIIEAYTASALNLVSVQYSTLKVA
jgi:predicted RNase H-like HicB family nuclease